MWGGIPIENLTSSSIEEQWLAIDQSGRGSNEWKPCLAGCESVTMTHCAMYPGSSWYNSLRSRQNTAFSFKELTRVRELLTRFGTRNLTPNSYLRPENWSDQNLWNPLRLMEILHLIPQVLYG